MKNTRPSFWRRLLPANFRDPVGLARRILRSRDRAAYFAMASTAIAAMLTPLDVVLAATSVRSHLRAAITLARLREPGSARERSA